MTVSKKQAAAETPDNDVEVIKFNVNKLSLGDLADLEDACGMSLLNVDLDKLPLKAAIGLFWIIRRQHDPKYTYADARNLTIDEAEAFKDFLSQITR